MLTFPANVRLFLANRAVDGRKSFNGLAALVEGEFDIEPTNGDLFIFLNKRASQVRMLFWDRDGFCLIAKRLELGTFKRVKKDTDEVTHIEIDAADLAMLLEGVEATHVRRTKRWKKPKIPD